MKELLIILTMLISLSCSFFVRPKVRFTIENKTSKDFKMLVYGKSLLLNSVPIRSQNKFDTTLSFSSPGSNGQNSPFNYEKVDSIVVLFSDRKIIRYYCNGNILVFEAVVSANCVFDKTPMYFNFDKTNPYKTTSYKSIIYDELDYKNAKPL